MNAENSTSKQASAPAVALQPVVSCEWTNYQPNRAREKTFYDIKLRDGEIVECCYPNGVGWYPMHPHKPSGHGRIADYRVIQIRKCTHPMDMADSEQSANTEIRRSGEPPQS